MQLLRNTTNPFTKTDSFKFYTQTADNYAIDSKTDGLSISFNCTYPCESCESDLTTCLSCLSSSPTPLLFNKICVNKCPSGNYMYNNICYQCNPACGECELKDKNNCISCSKSFPFMFKSLLNNTNTCLNLCPDNYFHNGNKCEICKLPCSNCMDTNKCLSCNSNYFYNSLNFTCSSVCPLNTLNINGTCQNCDKSCSGCLGNKDNCTQCNYDYIRSAYQKCVKYCPEGYQPYNGSCHSCNSNCKVCGENYNECQL